MDYPILNFDPHACLARQASGKAARAKCATQQSEVDAGMKAYRYLMYKVLESLPGVSYVDVSNAYCDGTDCWAMKDDVLLYRDGHHLSHDGSQYFAPYIKMMKGGLTSEPIAKQKALGPEAAPSGLGLPHILSITPSLGSGQSQVFEVVAAGGAGVKSLVLLINNVLNGSGACSLEYDRAPNQFQLASDAIVGQPPSKVGSGLPLSNSQCTLKTAESSASSDSDQVTINWSLTFSANFSGTKTIDAQVFNDAGVSSGWKYAGTWGVH